MMMMKLFEIEPSDAGHLSKGSYESGLQGEQLAALELHRAGWRVLGHRVRTRAGELDLVARRGDTVAFVEVKVAGPGRKGVEEVVDARAQHRLRRAAVAWMAVNPRLQQGVRRYRFDVMIVRRDRDGHVERIQHLRDAF